MDVRKAATCCSCDVRVEEEELEVKSISICGGWLVKTGL